MWYFSIVFVVCKILKDDVCFFISGMVMGEVE